MFLDPDSFERIHESVSRSQRKCKFAVVDSFTLFMLLQLHGRGKRYAEQKISLEILRPYFARAKDKKDRRKEIDIIYFLEILQDAGMITFNVKEREVFYNFVKSKVTKLSTLKEPQLRKHVFIMKCNSRLMEDYKTNVPFALHCLLLSLRRSEDGVLDTVRISFEEMAERLDISLATLGINKRMLDNDGYIVTVGEAKQTPDGLIRASNKYWIFNYDKRRPEKNKILKMRRQEEKAKAGKKKWVKIVKIKKESAEPTQTKIDATIKSEELAEIKQEVTLLAEKGTKKIEQTTISKEVAKTEQEIMSEIVRVINEVKQPKSYLFLGKVYDKVFDKVYEKIYVTNVIKFSSVKIIEPFSVSDSDFNFSEFADFCTNGHFFEGRMIVLRLKNRAIHYQTKLLVPLDRLKIPLLVFADSDGLIGPFVSRFTAVFKQPNENLQVTAFIPPNQILLKRYIDSPYACPSLIKLGNYNKLSNTEKKIDIFISKLSGDGKVYPEVLSELQPPIKTFDHDVKMEALSLLKKRLDS